MENLDSEVVERQFTKKLVFAFKYFVAFSVVLQHMRSGKQITDEKWRNRLNEISHVYKILQAEANQPQDVPVTIKMLGSKYLCVFCSKSKQ